ncbi:MAG: hypothetical protein KatS3mg110_2582 [Pirellulaceae bacterium]|nr:MAG: hypothetical protein KatS3mg110_2582 [Pirellulaceae bacterium]
MCSACGTAGLFAVMEYVEGGTLRQFMAEKHSYVSWARFFARLAEALAYAHAQGFIHRDLDPDNILVDTQGQPHVTDFGLAIHEDQQAARRGERAGSWAYMAPEQVRGESHRLDGRADLWAVGVLLYECLTGRRPFRGDSLDELLDQILHYEPKPPRQIDPDIPAALESICLKCLRKDPAQRWTSAAELAEALRRFARATDRGLTRRAFWAGLPVAGLTVAAAGWFAGRYWFSPHPPATLRADVLVWRRNQWCSLRQAWVLPLRNDDMIRIEIQCQPPRLLYVMWHDLANVTTPLYPWRDGRWTERVPEQVQHSVILPSERLDLGLPVKVNTAGHEWLLVGCRSNRLGKNVALAHLLSSVPPLKLPNDMAVSLSLDQVEYLVQSRGVEAGAPRHIQDPVLAFQTALVERCGPHFMAIYCMALPVAP